jgi:DtxR family Mn-dependent transcriptional regulator
MHNGGFMSPANLNILLMTLLAIAVLIILLLPGRGIISRIKTVRQNQKRELLEDTLKFIFNQQQSGRSASVEALEGKLKVSSKKAIDLVNLMESQGLIQHNMEYLELTVNGEMMALQIVRAHRLWERYLADEARIPLDKVHTIAHQREHGMSVDEINDLDASLGHPLTDPHGDPIPDSEGRFRPFEQGKPLTAWEEDQLAKIIHLEDEPPLAYAQIVAAGLVLGQEIRIIEKNSTRFVITDGLNEFTLAPAVAANVFVQAISQAEMDRQNAIRLSDLSTREKAEIIELDERVQGFTRRRFLDLGLTPGTVIFPELDNSFGDPRAFRVRGTLIALRKEQANDIWVRPVAQ